MESQRGFCCYLLSWSFFDIDFLSLNCKFFAYCTYLQFIYHYVFHNQIIYCVIPPNNFKLHWKLQLWGSTKTEEMLSCFKITANRFKNSYKLVIIDSPWFPLILNFSLYAIIQDLTPTERNKYLIRFALDFQSDLLMALSSTKIHRFSLFLEYASSTFRSEKPDCYIQRNDIQAGKFYIEAQTKISLGQFGCQIKPIKLLSASDVGYGQLYR